MKIPFPQSHHTRGFLICFGIAMFVLILYPFGFFDNLENRAVDFRFNLRGERPVNEDIVIIEIDEDSMSKLGRWPWDRSLHARLTRRLEKAGANVVAFDSLFSEVDKNNPAGDQAFAKAAEESEAVATAFHFLGGITDKIIGRNPLLPYDALLENVYIGFVNLEPDQDGVTRRAHLYAIDGDTVYPSLAVATLALSQKKTLTEMMKDLPVTLTKDPDRAENALFINFRGLDHPRFSYSEVLEGSFDPQAFKDKTVFIGATATALFDLKAIPFSSIYPGVEIHANIVDNLLANDFMREISSIFTGFYVALLGVVLGLILPRLSTASKLIAFIVIVAGGLVVGYWLFSNRNIILHLVPPLFAGLGCYGSLLFYQVVIEEREKRKIKGSFRQYLSPKIIEVITKDPAKLKLGGEEKTVTIFFLDIAGFTTMSEVLGPTQLVEVMNGCLTTFSNVILKHDGLINKYIGDCIMAFWNAPADQPKHASQACMAALDCIQALPEINAEFEKHGLPKAAKIDCRVGINSGVVVVGNMGSNERFDYTVMGDAVNLASRLEGANKQYNSRVMISDTTFNLAKEDIEARDLDLIRVKGKKEPRKVFELLGRRGEMSHQLEQARRIYHEGLHDYRQKNFKDAQAKLKQVFDYSPGDHLTKVYLERIDTFLQSPPPSDWDGVFELKNK